MLKVVLVVGPIYFDPMGSVTEDVALRQQSNTDGEDGGEDEIMTRLATAIKAILKLVICAKACDGVLL
jgi:hypothetical protein